MGDMSKSTQKKQKSELEKFKLFFEETPAANPLNGRLRRNKAGA
jgi:hypothetical protein